MLIGDPSEIRALYAQGVRPSAILRKLALSSPTMAYPMNLILTLQAAFDLGLADVSCIGGWRHDGTGEMSDAQIDGFLIPAIEKSYGART